MNEKFIKALREAVAVLRELFPTLGEKEVASIAVSMAFSAQHAQEGGVRDLNS